MNFFETLTKRAQEANSLLCIGLDPRVDTPSEAKVMCFRIIDATAPYAAAFKPNAAFFERLGPDGWAVLKEVIDYVPEGIPVILDAKRGDIADTAEAYAQSTFTELRAHAITANPYLGRDSLAPFLNQPEHGVFALCKTSNPGANDLQTLMVEGGTLYEYVAAHVPSWSEHDNIGLVVGATDPRALARVRAIAPSIWFLVPGIGAQGGELEKALQAGLRTDGMGMLINASRAVANATDPAEAAKKLRDEINQGRGAREQGSKGDVTPQHPSALAQDLVSSQCVRFGQFTLKSGKLSPIYLDLRRLVTHPIILRRVAQAYAKILNGLTFDRIVGIPYAALPIATAIALEMNRPLIYPRREAKDYGTRASIEGDFNAGETVVVIDDLATTGETKIEIIERLEAAGLKVIDIVVLIDREQGAQAYLKERGYNYYAVTGLRNLLNEWKMNGTISDAQFEEVEAFLAS
jgi:uridine monophosphate synthetase